jgi:hypothetical protein
LCVAAVDEVDVGIGAQAIQQDSVSGVGGVEYLCAVGDVWLVHGRAISFDTDCAGS